MSTDTGENLLNPGDTPHDNAQFLVFCVGRHPRRRQVPASCSASTVAGAGNDHRLGANEAPPAIISIFLGDQLQDVIDQLEKGDAEDAPSRAAFMEIGVERAAEAAEGRRRPQPHRPFAFTGNKFEFRAVGIAASASPARTRC